MGLENQEIKVANKVPVSFFQRYKTLICNSILLLATAASLKFGELKPADNLNNQVNSYRPNVIAYAPGLPPLQSDAILPISRGIGPASYPYEAANPYPGGEIGVIEVGAINTSNPPSLAEQQEMLKEALRRTEAALNEWEEAIPEAAQVHHRVLGTKFVKLNVPNDAEPLIFVRALMDQLDLSTAHMTEPLDRYALYVNQIKKQQRIDNILFSVTFLSGGYPSRQYAFLNSGLVIHNFFLEKPYPVYGQEVRKHEEGHAIFGINDHYVEGPCIYEWGYFGVKNVPYKGCPNFFYFDVMAYGNIITADDIRMAFGEDKNNNGIPDSAELMPHIPEFMQLDKSENHLQNTTLISSSIDPIAPTLTTYATEPWTHLKMQVMLIDGEETIPWSDWQRQTMAYTTTLPVFLGDSIKFAIRTDGGKTTQTITQTSELEKPKIDMMLPREIGDENKLSVIDNDPTYDVVGYRFLFQPENYNPRIKSQIQGFDTLPWVETANIQTIPIPRIGATTEIQRLTVQLLLKDQSGKILEGPPKVLELRRTALYTYFPIVFKN